MAFTGANPRSRDGAGVDTHADERAPRFAPSTARQPATVTACPGAAACSVPPATTSPPAPHGPTGHSSATHPQKHVSSKRSPRDSATKPAADQQAKSLASATSPPKPCSTSSTEPPGPKCHPSHASNTTSTSTCGAQNTKTGTPRSHGEPHTAPAERDPKPAQTSKRRGGFPLGQREPADTPAPPGPHVPERRITPRHWRPVGHRTQRPARHAHTESLTPPRPKETLNPPRQANGVAGSRLDSGNPPTRRHRQDHTYQSDGSHPATGTKTPCGKYLATLTGMPTTRPRLAVRGHPRHGLLAPGTSVRRPRHRCWRDWPRGDVGTPTRAESGCLTLPTRECGGEGEGGSATRRAGSPRCVPRRPRADRLDKASGVPAAAVSGRVLCLGRSSRARDRPGPVGWQARNVCRARRVGETERQAGEPDCACGAVSLSRQSKGVVVRGLRHHP